MSGTGSASIPSAARSASVASSWNTGPPSSTRGSQKPLGRRCVACSSISSPAPPDTGSSWHSMQPSALKRGPSPVSCVKTLSKRARPRANMSFCSLVRPGTGSPGSSRFAHPTATTRPPASTATPPYHPPRRAHGASSRATGRATMLSATLPWPVSRYWIATGRRAGAPPPRGSGPACGSPRPARRRCG